MTKAQLIEEVSLAVEMTRKDSEVIVEAIFDSVVHATRRGKDRNQRSWKLRYTPAAAQELELSIFPVKQERNTSRLLHDNHVVESTAANEAACSSSCYNRIGRTAETARPTSPYALPYEML